MNQDKNTGSEAGKCPPPPPNPPFEYEDPLGEVKKAQDELEKDKKRNEARQAALKLLDQAAKEREQARAAYEKAEEGLLDDHDLLTCEAARVLNDAKNDVGAEVATKIDEIVLGYGGKISEAKEKVNTLKNEARQRSTTYRQAVWYREDAQETFNDVRDTPKNKGDAIKLAKDLLARAKNEEKGDDPRIYYYVAKRLSLQVYDNAIDPLSKVEEDLKSASKALTAAVEAERLALIAWEEKKVDLERAKKEVAEWESQHDERMLPKVRALTQPAGGSARGGNNFQGANPGSALEGGKQADYEQKKQTSGAGSRQEGEQAATRV